MLYGILGSLIQESMHGYSDSTIYKTSQDTVQGDCTQAMLLGVGIARLTLQQGSKKDHIGASVLTNEILESYEISCIS